LRKVAVDPPVAHLIGMVQRVARNLPAETPLIMLGLLRAQTRFDIAQAAAISELREQQAKEPIPTREVLVVAIALVAIDTDLILVSRKKIQKLSKNAAAHISPLPSAWVGKQPDHARKGPQKTEIGKKHPDRLLSLSQVVTPKGSTFLGHYW